MKSKIVGGIILLLVIIVIIAFQFVNVNKPEEITVSGYLGGEKEGLMQDEEVKKILKDKYGITVEYTKAGSIEMIEQDSSDKDYLFPSSQTALELFNQTKSDKLYKSEIVFNSPIVIYTWKPIAEALINNGIVEEKDEIDKLTNDCAKTGSVLELVVKSNIRSNGIGKSLLDKIEEYFRSIYCKRINIEVFGPNKKGLNFYEKNDYIIRDAIVSKRL